MLKASQVCKVLGISPDTLLRLIRAGEFPGALKTSRRPQSHWRIPEQALEEYLKRNTVTPREEARTS